MPLHHSGHVSAIKSPAIKLKSPAVDQRGCQIYVWPSFYQAQAGNIWTEMLSVMWQSFTTGCTLSAQDNSGLEIRSRWRTPEYFTEDLVFNFQPSSLQNPFSQSTTKLYGEDLMRRDCYWVTDSQGCSITCYPDLQRRFSAFYTISCGLIASGRLSPPFPLC